MKIHYILLAVIGLISTNSCREKEPVYPERISLKNIPEYTLQMDTLKWFGAPFPPEIFLINDSTLLLSYYNDAGQLTIFDVHEKEMDHISIRKQSDRIKISSNPDFYGKVNLWHKASRHYYEFVAEKGKLRIDSYERLKIGANSPYKALKLPDNLYIGLGNYTKGLFGIYNPEKRKMTFSGTFPLNESKYYNKMFVSTFKGYMDVQENKVVYVSENFGYISFYEYKKGKLKKKWENQLTDFVYKTIPNRIELDSINCYGFEGVQIINDHIYALYKGHSEITGIARNSLLVFNKDGKLLARYYFPYFMNFFVVDSSENYVYTSSTPYMRRNTLARYRLSDLSKLPELP